MVGKILLPVYGGTPAVWTVCMLFFQAVLLVAYGYVWFLSRIPHWRIIHGCVCLLSLLALPLAFSPVSGDGIPEWLILENLLRQLGLPLLVIASSAPLLQYVFSQSAGKQAADPYYLYTASNVGSLLALLSFPWLIERFSGVNQQFHVWNGIYALYLALLLWILTRSKIAGSPEQVAGRLELTLPWKRCAIWVFLSFIPCSLMMGVTFYISTDIAATPLFWVLPLALYLLSFVITFARKPIASHAWVIRYSLLFLLLPVIGFIMGTHQIPAWQLIVANLLSFFVLALLCHGELVGMRPDVSQLTTFYFCLALGGVLAGVFNGLLAPRLFVQAYDYPLVILLAVLCIPLRKKYYVFFGLMVLFVFMPWSNPKHVLNQQRNFYGIKQVFSQSGAHVLMSQSTIHGFQVLQDANPTDGARAYYASVLPVVQQLQAAYQPLHAMVVGLGTGIMACQFRAQDKLSMVEIDEQVMDIARDPGLFTYLRDCPPQTTLIHDDGRLAIAKEPDASLELLVIDAFTSDAIPVHLLTLEAFMLYQKKIIPDGVILVNISNRHLRVLPVLTAAGRRLDMIVLHKQQGGDTHLGQLASEWALLTTNEVLAAHLLSQQGWRFVADAEARLWTNDYSNIAPLLRWNL